MSCETSKIREFIDSSTFGKHFLGKVARQRTATVVDKLPDFFETWTKFVEDVRAAWFVPRRGAYIVIS